MALVGIGLETPVSESVALATRPPPLKIVMDKQSIFTNDS